MIHTACRAQFESSNYKNIKNGLFGDLIAWIYQKSNEEMEKVCISYVTIYSILPVDEKLELRMSSNGDDVYLALSSVQFLFYL